MASMQLRAYQARIVREAMQGGNAIAVLPTGSGKTLIAAELIKQVSSPCLFLVPTILLVEQQAQAVRNWTGLNVKEYFGGATLPQQFDVLVSTPKAFQMAQGRGTQNLQWSALGLVVFDEVHHVLKDHPYRKLALHLSRLRDQAGPSPKVLGLTASLTYAVGKNQVEAAIQRICKELQVNVMATATDEEMRASGYLGTRAEAEVRPVVLPGVVPSGVVSQEERKPHLMHRTFFGRLRAGTSTRVSIDLHKLVVAMESAVVGAIPDFQSPLGHSSLKTWGEKAHALASVSPMCRSLEYWYEALRTLVVSWEEAEDAAVTFLRMSGEEAEEPQCVWPPAVRAQLASFWASVPNTFPRFEHLKDSLLYKHEQLANASKEFRGLLFVQQRVTTHILEYLIQTDPELATLFRPACIYATSSPATPSLAVSTSQSKSRLAQFGSGEVNLLITTVVAEEGMDVPAANCVVSFDPMINAVSLVQRRGRARQEDSAFLVLSEREDRTAARLADVEKQQMAIVSNFQPRPRDADNGKEVTAQQSRERGAGSVLNGVADPAGALAALNLYCKKTKVDLVEEYIQNGGGWSCTLRYSSVLRTISVNAVSSPTADVNRSADVKKHAKRSAALQLVQALQREVVAPA